MSVDRSQDHAMVGNGRLAGYVLAVSLVAGLAVPRAVLGEESGCPLAGIAGSELSLAQAYSLALCSNAELQAAAATVGVRAAQLGEARSQYWPTLSATTTEVHEHTQYPGEQASSTTDTATTIYGALTWRLLDFGGRRATTVAATKLLEAALAARDATTQKVLEAVVQTYFDAVAAKALVENKVQDQRLGEETLGSAQRRLAGGDGSQNDELQARTALARITLELNRAQGTYDKALALLAYTVGIPVDVRFEVPDDADHPFSSEERSLNAWLDDARLRHPAILAARAEVAAADAQVVAARSAGLPTVDFQANYYANGFPQEGLSQTRQRDTTVGISITIPLFEGFLNHYKVREAEADVAVKRAVLIDTERATLTEIVKAYTDAKSTVANLKASQTLLEAALASESSSKRRYDSGAADILELLTAQVAVADARQERVRSLAEWRSARLRLLATAAQITGSAAAD